MDKEQWYQLLKNLPAKTEENDEKNSVIYCRIYENEYMTVFNYCGQFIVRRLSQTKFYYFTLETCAELLDFLMVSEAVQISREDIPDYYFQK